MKLGTDSIAPLVVNLIETYTRNTPQDTVKQGAAILATLKKTAVVDGIRGLTLDMEEVSEALGDLAIC
jgi:hypothetical protein